MISAAFLSSDPRGSNSPSNDMTIHRGKPAAISDTLYDVGSAKDAARGDHALSMPN